MNDREMLCFLYGVLKMMPNTPKEVVRQIEKQLEVEVQTPPPIVAPKFPGT